MGRNRKPLVYTPPNIALLMEYNKLKRFQVRNNPKRAGMYLRVYANGEGSWVGMEKIRVMGKPSMHYGNAWKSLHWGRATELRNSPLDYDCKKGGYFHDTLKQSGGYLFNSKTLAFIKKLCKTDHFTVWCLLEEKPHNEETFREYSFEVNDSRRWDDEFSRMIDDSMSSDPAYYGY